jgi:hypothetical protein
VCTWVLRAMATAKKVADDVFEDGADFKVGPVSVVPEVGQDSLPSIVKAVRFGTQKRNTHHTHTHTHTPHAHTRLFHALPPPHRHCGIMTLGNAALVLHRNASLAPPMRASSQGTQVEPFFTLRPHSTFFFVHSLTHSSTPTHSHTPLLSACPTQPELSEEESAAIMVTEKGPEEA